MKRTDIKKILVIGSGPIVIGQGAEFDYSGTQACLALKEEGYQVILINSNPATIMTDTLIADKVYLEPLTLESAKRVIYKERPDAILGTLGGQTGLNLTVDLAKSGILKQFNVEILGTSLEAINKASDRELFKELMLKIQEPMAESFEIETIEEAKKAANKIGYPVVIRPFYTLGGTGGGFASNENELIEISKSGLSVSPIHKCLVEKSLSGYKEIEYEVIRDNKDNAIVICGMENVDPVGIHTGDSIVVAPLQTLTDKENQMLRDVSLKIIRALKICGGCNVQIALDPNSFRYYIIEVNPRVSRSSALASKATGYPIAEISAKLAVGLTLDEIINPVTKTSSALFEPTLDYLVIKFPRFPFDKFPTADSRLTTQMKATGEVMSIGTSFEEAILKAIRSLEMKIDSLEYKGFNNKTIEELLKYLTDKDYLQIFAIGELLRRNYSIEKIHDITKVDKFFLNKLLKIALLEEEVKNNKLNLEVLKKAKKMNLANSYISRVWNISELELEAIEKDNNLIPVYKMVDTCAGEFSSSTPYFYSTYKQENESKRSNKNKIIVLGSGPIRIGQGVEFDYATVHCILTIKKANYEAIVINNNPETVSTDFKISDKLYFEPLTIEDVINIVNLEKPLGVIVQFGGQTAINLTEELTKRNIKILGTQLEGIDQAEDRNQFEKLMAELKIPTPKGASAFTLQEAKNIAHKIGFPIVIRPSYVLGGRAMQIVNNDEELDIYMQHAVKEISHNSPVLLDKYIKGKEVEIDAISDGKEVFIPGIMSQVERAGIHSGDSTSIYPPTNLSKKVKETIVKYTTQIGIGFKIIGLFNIQFDVDFKTNKVYVIEVNPRSSRTIPYLSKATNVRMCEIATLAILGKSLKEQGIKPGLKEEIKDCYFVKHPAFSFSKIRSVDTTLGPEMKSTGESLGIDISLNKAMAKAFLGTGVKLPLSSNVLITTSDRDKEQMLPLAKRFFDIGYGIYATSGTAKFLKDHGLVIKEARKVSEKVDLREDVLSLIRSKKVTYVINTQLFEDRISSLDGFFIRRVSWENGVFCMTCLDTVSALLDVLEDESYSLLPLKEE